MTENQTPVQGCCSKKHGMFIVAWAVLATLYIVWNLLQVGAYRLGADSAKQQVLADLIAQATQQVQSGCKQPIVVGSGNGQIGLVNVACLQQPANEQPAANPVAPAKK